ncbi:filamentous hemagglutinin N-terminal domain-containing protein [Microcoleus sp. herbarium7]|uniref:two-partner secretion domain-containing protein n=1 Tax=Microcoleus sp. herbarium7 TaxID=3055435 RepID=UPI002FD6F348
MIAKSWLKRCWHWQLGGCVAILGTLSVGVSDRVNAQIVPDNTLGAEGSVVTPNLNLNGIPSDQIDGGAIRGANLFHSFTQFNINAGRGAYFTNPAGIANILSRVTGANRSDILGRLGVLGGNANLFLINPNGIVFGPGASLDLQGSFAATTANAVEFGDRGIFSASAPESPQLLNVNPSAFLFNQIPPGSITNRSAVLQVPQGQNLILLGGNVNLDGGVLQAPSGRVELAGLAESGRVGINQDSNNLSLIFPDGGVRADISLSDRASIEAGGDIQVQGRRVTLTEGSRIKAVTQGAAKAGNITVNTGQLIVRDGAQVTASTSGRGQGGTVVVNAFESIELSGTSTNGQQSGLFADTQSAGDAGDIKVDTGQLTLSDRALITSRSTGIGRAGNIVVTVRGTLQANNGTLGTSATQSAGGAITVKAGDIRLFGDSNITTSVFDGTGGGGNIYLEADSILAFDDSDILAFADGGKGGDITLDTPAFFGENYRPKLSNTDPADTPDKNNRVDLNAAGAVEGVIITPDTSSIENSLTELPDDRIDIDSLLATSCIARRDRPTRGSFTVTGTGGLQERPGDAQMSNFPTVDVETLPSDSTPSTTNPNRSWQKGDPIVEPQGVYRLPNGQLVLSRECP